MELVPVENLKQNLAFHLQLKLTTKELVSLTDELGCLDKSDVQMKIFMPLFKKLVDSNRNIIRVNKRKQHGNTIIVILLLKSLFNSFNINVLLFIFIFL